MKNKLSQAYDVQTGNHSQENPLAELLNKAAGTPDLTSPESAAASIARYSGVALATISDVDDLGQARVSLPELQLESVSALSLCPLGKEQIGQQCAVQFINGDPNQPLVIGILITEQQNTDSKHRNAEETWVKIAAEEEILLTCGESSIRLGADGVIELRGVYISSDAMATQRLRGGSVQVN